MNNNGGKPVHSLEEEPGSSKTIPIPKVNSLSPHAFFTSTEDLVAPLSLREDEKTLLERVEKKYHMKIPSYYFSLIQDPQNLHDPILQQCVPSVQELHDTQDEMIDPLAEEKTSPVSCLVHRYPDRALLIVTSRCFMYCRHCTRKRLWKDNIPDPGTHEIEQALEYIKQHKKIREIIVSGGDPLTLSTKRIDYILSSLSRIPTLDVMRIGTRAPVVLPQRIDDTLCRVFKKYTNLWINVQFNHPREITEESIAACRKIQNSGVPMSNQSVLLKGINDDPKTMTQLCHKLQQIRVRPYYLYECDPVVGASHFRTSIWKGVEIIEKMRGHTSGMCIPAFVIDGIEGKGKIPLNPEYVVAKKKDGVMLRNYKQETFFYKDPSSNDSFPAGQREVSSCE